MMKIEFLYVIVMDIHAKGSRLLDPLEIFPLHISCCKVRFVFGGYEVPQLFGVCIMP
jgi:hypothetical protein